MIGMKHWQSKGRGYWRLEADCAVTMLAEAAIDPVQWEIGSIVGSLFERVLVVIGVLVIGMVGVA